MESEDVNSQLSDGYLSIDAPAWISEFRRIHRHWFDLAQRVNRVGMTILKECPPNNNVDQLLIIALLHMRGLQSFQSGILLAERGLAADGCSLARSTIENAFCAGALLKNEAKYLRLMTSQYQKHRGATARAIVGMKNLDEQTLTNRHRSNLNSVIRETSGYSGQWKWDAVAEEAEMMAGYDLIYRPLSAEASHPTLGSLMRHISSDDSSEITELKWYPDQHGVDEAVAYLCNSYLFLADVTVRAFGHDVLSNEVAAVVQGFGDTYKKAPPAPRYSSPDIDL